MGKKLQKCQSRSRKKLKLKSKNCKTQIENEPPPMSGSEESDFVSPYFLVFFFFGCCNISHFFLLCFSKRRRQHSIKIQFAIEFVFTRYPATSPFFPAPSIHLSLFCLLLEDKLCRTYLWDTQANGLIREEEQIWFRFLMGVSH